MANTFSKMTTVGSQVTKKETSYLILGVEKRTKNAFTDEITISTEEGTVLQSNDQDELSVSGVDIGHRDVVVATTGLYINKMIGFAMKKKRMDVLRIMKSLDVKIREADVDALYTVGGDTWKDFCSDIVDYYCFRYRVFKTPMPVCKGK